MESAGPPTGPAGSDDRDDGVPRRLQPTVPPTEMPASAPSPGGDLAGMTIRGGDDATMVSAITMDSDMDPLLGAESARRHRGGSGWHMGTIDEGDPHSAAQDEGRTEVPGAGGGVREPGPEDPWLDRLEARILAQNDPEAGGSGMSGGIRVRSTPTDRLQQRIDQRRREKIETARARSLSASHHSSPAGGDTGVPPGYTTALLVCVRTCKGARCCSRRGPGAAGDVPMVQVSAPSVLPGGYVFDAVANGQTFSVTVPAGGVSRGQTFSAPFEPGGGGLSASAVPEGRWKDGLCDCCMFGCCHPALWMGICCRLALLGQVQNRLRLNWLGVSANPGDRSPFKILLGISILDSILLILTFYIDDNGLPTTLSEYSAITMVCRVISIAVAVFWIYVASKTRRYIRERSGIPEKSCQGCEDCCCAYWCSCCMVLQMAGHTADYETYAAKCCSETGLPVNAPQLHFGGSQIV